MKITEYKEWAITLNSISKGGVSIYQADKPGSDILGATSVEDLKRMIDYYEQGADWKAKQ